MILFGQFLIAIGAVLNMILDVFFILFIVRAVASWFSPDPRNPLMQFLYNTTEPVLSRIRSKMPSLGMFDLSVIIAIFGVYFLQIFVAGSLEKYGALFAAQGGQIVGAVQNAFPAFC